MAVIPDKTIIFRKFDLWWPKWLRMGSLRAFERRIARPSSFPSFRVIPGVILPPPPTMAKVAETATRARFKILIWKYSKAILDGFDSIMVWIDFKLLWSMWFYSIHDSSGYEWCDSDSIHDSSGYELCDSIRFMIQAKIIWFRFIVRFKSESLTSLIGVTICINYSQPFAEIVVGERGWQNMYSQERGTVFHKCRSPL